MIHLRQRPVSRSVDLLRKIGPMNWPFLAFHGIQAFGWLISGNTKGPMTTTTLTSNCRKMVTYYSKPRRRNRQSSRSNLINLIRNKIHKKQLRWVLCTESCWDPCYGHSSSGGCVSRRGGGSWENCLPKGTSNISSCSSKLDSLSLCPTNSGARAHTTTVTAISVLHNATLVSGRAFLITIHGGSKG